jgi:uncharacterized membrane protein
MSPLLIAILRAVHVIASSFWLGAMLLNAGFLLPAVRVTGPAGGQVMRQIVQVRRLPAFLNTAVLLTLLTGGVLFWRVSGGLTISWLSSGAGLGWSVGGTLAIIAALLGHFVNAPAARRYGQLAAEAQAAGGPPSGATVAEMQRLQLRLLSATQLAAALLVVAAAAMGAARYLR